MKFPKLLMVGLLSLGTIVMSALPSMARPGSIYSAANLRAEPSVNSQRIDGLPEGTPLEALKVSMAPGSSRPAWYYIRSTGNLRTEGWVSAALITFESSNQTYGHLLGDPGDVINIRSAPNLQSKVIHTGLMGDLVEVGESKFVPEGTSEPGRYYKGRTGYYWYKITYTNGASGWVRGDLINVWP